MAIKKILDDFQNALLITQAGIRGTLKSLRKAQSKAKKLTARKHTNKPKGKPRKRLSGKNPSDPMQLARSVVEAAIGQPLVRTKPITYRPKKQVQSRKKTTSRKAARTRSR